jgi:hypothetical protein
MTLLRTILLLLLLWHPSVAAQSGGPDLLPDPTRTPVLRIGIALRTMIIANGIALRVEIEPVRDVIGIWGEVGFLTTNAKRGFSRRRTPFELGAGIRLHPIPFGDVARIYIDGAVKRYWGRDLWSLGAGAQMLPEFRSSIGRIALGLCYDREWAPAPTTDTAADGDRPEESIESRPTDEEWDMMWVNGTLSIDVIPTTD